MKAHIGVNDSEPPTFPGDENILRGSTCLSKIPIELFLTYNITNVLMRQQEVKRKSMLYDATYH
jgi:hypothetical protein